MEKTARMAMASWLLKDSEHTHKVLESEDYEDA